MKVVNSYLIFSVPKTYNQNQSEKYSFETKQTFNAQPRYFSQVNFGDLKLFDSDPWAASEVVKPFLKILRKNINKGAKEARAIIEEAYLKALRQLVTILGEEGTATRIFIENYEGCVPGGVDLQKKNNVLTEARKIYEHLSKYKSGSSGVKHDYPLGFPVG